MTIEIKLTCETVAEAQAEMATLLRGTNITFGSVPTAIAPVAPTPPAASPPTSDEPASPTSNTTTSEPNSTPSESGSTGAPSSPVTDTPLAASLNPDTIATSEPNSSASELEAKYDRASSASSPETSCATTSEPNSTPSEQPKKGRGRPRKELASAATVEPGQADGAALNSDAAISSEATATSDEEQIGLPLGSEAVQPSGATEPAEPTSDDASSTSSETVIAHVPNAATEEALREIEAGQVVKTGSVAETMAELNSEQPAVLIDAGNAPAADIQSVSDVDLQRFCAKLADKFGGPQKVFNACKPFIAKGDVARPTNIKRNEDRWAFIRRMEAQSGMKYHG